MSKQKELFETSRDLRLRNTETLQQENQSLNDVKTQLEDKVYDLEKKLSDSENLTDKLKKDLKTALEHENKILGETMQMMNEKETQLLELQSEVNGLKQKTNEKKIGKIIK